MDINALKLKTKNMAKKIENATKYIEEIDNHKKSIFEFWRYSNKDEMSVLPEGEKEELNAVKKIEKTFNDDKDIENSVWQILKKDECDSIYIATTELIDILNNIKNKDITPEEIERNLKKLKREAKELKLLDEEEYDIFGNIIEDNTKVKKINNKKHREVPRDKYDILEINKNTKAIGYKLNLQMILQNILTALEKSIIPETLSIYKATYDEELNNKEINIFNINPEREMQEAIKNCGEKINLYKLNIKEGTKGIGFTNIIFFNNKNKTLPVGMDLSTKIIINISKLNLKLLNKKSFKIADIEDENNDFSYIDIKDINVFEYEVLDVEDIQEE